MTPIELLAPARDLACGLAAIDCGADAVYIGAPRFGARAKAGNPLEDIEALARHAHTYWAKVYVTVNTLLSDNELPQVVRLLHQLHEIGVDAAIVQDTGLLECDLPPLPLIASTQMHNHTPKRVAFLESQEKKRVSRPTPEAPVVPVRFSPLWVKSHRQRLGLSAQDYGRLVGVSALTVYNWESGKSKPRKEALAAVAAVRGLGKREALKRLEILSG